MRTLKYLLFTILGIIVLVLIAAAVLPNDFEAGSKIVINKPKKEVFDYVKLLRNQGNYDNWSRQDPQIQREYTGTDGQPGFTYTWKSDKVGDGKQVITEVDSSAGRIDMYIFFNGSEDASPSFMEVLPLSDSSSQVIWKVEGKMPYPFNLMSLFYDMNADFDAGLAHLKDILEK
ncbi:SRPBCC family protein [Sphingobacterium lactis]|uniref:Polyketide cyclase / dehydrase and lipid transport n=1 Tax=Sphingobacterium lactis TaxID=797291 RepID=A0A1H5UL68_9SPHI|nr:SRPBCC family protein [Sphingobacterium lactis]SEF75141.1 Polyketide cyclase / dehydrase and lipid transport [Sphingobacterium lactis]